MDIEIHVLIGLANRLKEKGRLNGFIIVFDISGDWALGPVSKQRPNTHQMSIKEHISISVFLGRSQNLAFSDFRGFKFYPKPSFLRIS